MAYSIGEFAAIVGVPASTLRYYEKEGLITPRRDANQVREYEEGDIGWTRFILHLKGSGMSVEELKSYTEWRAEGDKTIPQRLDLLEKRRQLVREEMQKLQQSLDLLDRKIEFYREKPNNPKLVFAYPHP
ncbi:MerR family transcriptional regulator [Saccharibacillus sacchari]|uniref:MerR family transcriptional regulator n=1 Tax=Saccharibacillus sacchari TaxID=456493 RepID=A0ACC6PE42_9BACL